MQTHLLNTLQHHLERLPGAPEAEQTHHRERILQVLSTLRREPAKTREDHTLRKRLDGLERALRERRLPSDYEPLMREVELCLESRPSDGAAPPVLSPIEQVAGLLRGRVLVVVGGNPQPEHVEKLRRSFALSHVRWPATNEHAIDVAALEPDIARDDVAAVILLIRWTRHLNELANTCRRHDKPLVRAPGGYNVNQIAANILEQISRRLDDGRA